MKNEHYILMFCILIFVPLTYSQCIINEIHTNKCKLCSSNYYPSSYTQNFIYFETDNATCLPKTKEYLFRKVFIRKIINKECSEDFDYCYEKLEDMFRNETNNYLDYLKGELNIFFEQGDYYINNLNTSEYFRRFDLSIKISALDFKNEVKIIFNVPFYFFVSNNFEINGITFEFDLDNDSNNVPSSIYGVINVEILFDHLYNAIIPKIYLLNCKFFGRSLIRSSSYYSFIHVGYFGGSILLEKCYFSNFFISNGLVDYSSMSFFSSLNIYLDYTLSTKYAELSGYMKNFSTLHLIEVKFSNYNFSLDNQKNFIINLEKSLGQINFENIIFDDFSFQKEINLISIQSIYTDLFFTNILLRNMKKISFLICVYCEFLFIYGFFMENIYELQNYLVRIRYSTYLSIANAYFVSMATEINIDSILLYIENTYVLFKRIIICNSSLGGLIQIYKGYISFNSCQFVSIMNTKNIFIMSEVRIFFLINFFFI